MSGSRTNRHCVIVLRNYQYIGFFWYLKNLCTELDVSYFQHIHDLGTDIALIVVGEGTDERKRGAAHGLINILTA